MPYGCIKRGGENILNKPPVQKARPYSDTCLSLEEIIMRCSSSSPESMDQLSGQYKRVRANFHLHSRPSEEHWGLSPIFFSINGIWLIIFVASLLGAHDGRIFSSRLLLSKDDQSDVFPSCPFFSVSPFQEASSESHSFQWASNRPGVLLIHKVLWAITHYIPRGCWNFKKQLHKRV